MNTKIPTEGESQSGVVSVPDEKMLPCHDRRSSPAGHDESVRSLSATEGQRGRTSAATVSGRASRSTRTRWFLCLYTAIAGSLLLRISVLDFESGDYRAFLSNWYDHFLENGRWRGLGDYVGSYPPLYMYLLSLSSILPVPKLYAIKLISILFDYIAACFVFRIVCCAVAAKRVAPSPRPSPPLMAGERESLAIPWLAALGMLYLPTVWFNSAVWGQSDSMFTAALLGAFYFVMVKRPIAALVAVGLAGSLKPQAIFLAPFLAGIFFRERWSWKWLAIPPLVYVACGLPAILAGRPIVEMLFHWGRQQNLPRLTLGATNWYQWISNEYYSVFYLPGVVLTLIATTFVILLMQKSVLAWPLSPSDAESFPRSTSPDEPLSQKSLDETLTRPSGTLSRPTGEGRSEGGSVGSEGLAGGANGWIEDGQRARFLVTAALLSVLMVPYLLPGMHERYFYPADLFSLVYALLVRRGWIVAVLVQFCSFFSYLPYLFQEEPIPRAFLALVMTAAIALVAVKHTKLWFKST